MNQSYMNRIILSLCFSAFMVNAESAKDTFEQHVQACVLYETNENEGYPIPKKKCVEIQLGIDCNKKIVDSDASSKIWRAYPMLNCRNDNIKKGLSERYLLEGVD